MTLWPELRAGCLRNVVRSARGRGGGGTPDGNGVVVSSNLLKENVQVRLDKENETELTTYSVSEIKVIRDADVCDVDNFKLGLQDLEEDLD